MYPSKSIFDFSGHETIKLGVGKHEGERLEEIVENHQDYLEWFAGQKDVSDTDKQIILMAIEGLSEKRIKRTYRIAKKDRAFPFNYESAKKIKDEIDSGVLEKHFGNKNLV